MSSDFALSANMFHCDAQMCLRNTSPSTTSLYWLPDKEPRNLSAAFHSVALSSLGGAIS